MIADAVHTNDKNYINDMNNIIDIADFADQRVAVDTDRGLVAEALAAIDGDVATAATVSQTNGGDVQQ